MSELVSLIVAGVVTGSIYAVTASGLVVTYTTTGIFNFAHGAVGMILAYLFWQLWQGWNWPVLAALAAVVLVAAPLLGAAVERLVMRPLYAARTNVQLVVTLGLLLLLFGVATTVWKPTTTYTVPAFFSGRQVGIGGVNVTYEQLIAVAVAVAVAGLLRLLFTATRVGVAMRAVVDDPELAALTGAPSGRIAAYAWMIGVMLAGTAGILLAPTTMDVGQLTELVIYGYAAAIVGRLRSLPLTFLGAMILGIANSLAIGYAPTGVLTDVTSALPMALLLVVLLTMPEARLAVGRVVRVRPPRAASLRSTLTGATALVAVSIVLALTVTGNNLLTVGNALALGLLALSLVPLSGYGGQVSLAQYTFAGLGALAVHWVGRGGSPLGIVAGVAGCAAVGAVVAVPALRLRGLYLALATVAFAVLADNVFFVNASIMGSGGAVSVARPRLGGLGLSSDRADVVFIAVVFGACLVGVGALRRGRFGRRLVAMSDSPAACTTVGVSLTATKLAVFALSAGMAGLAGALYGGIGGSVGASQFSFLASGALFVAVTLAGGNILTAAVTAGVGLAVAPVIGSHIAALSNFTYLFFGVGIVSIGRNPNALGTVLVAAGEAWRRRRRPLPQTAEPVPLSGAAEVSTVG